MRTYDEVETMIEKYSFDPSREKYKTIISAIAELDFEDRIDAVIELLKHKEIHGKGKREITKTVELAMKSNETGDQRIESEFFEDGKFRPVRVTNALMESHDYYFTSDDGALRKYCDGNYDADRYSEIEREIHDMLGDWVRPHAVNQVISLLQDKVAGPMPFHKEWINLQNGRLCLYSFELLDHNPAFKSVIQVPVSYDKNAECPNFDEWLSDVLPKADDQMLLLQLMGYSMLQDVRFGKIAVLYGPTHTGKSTCLDLMKHFLGETNVSATSLHALDDEDMRFSRANLVGKLANVSADLSGKYLTGDSQIKQIASGDPMTVEFKGVQGFTYSPFATLWSSSNQLPVSHDRSDAWYERLVIIPFTRQHTGEKADRDLLPKLTQPEEMSGILNKVIEALKILLAENQFRTTESTNEMLHEYKVENDQVSRFLTDTCKLEDDARTDEDQLYTHYTDWCETEGIRKPLAKNKFRDGVKAWGGEHKRARDGEKRAFVYDKVRYTG